MSDNNELLTIIQAQHEVNRQTAAALGRIEQTLTDNTARLFGAPGQEGVIPYLHKQHEGIAKDVASLKLWKRGVLKWVAGVAAVLTMEGTVLAFCLSHLSQIDAVIRAATTVHK